MPATFLWIVLFSAAFFGLGYYLWSVARAETGHNIFGHGVILRGIVSAFCLSFVVIPGLGDGFLLLWLLIPFVFWIWTFVETWRSSNLIIGVLSLVYQGLSVIFVLQALSWFRGEL